MSDKPNPSALATAGLPFAGDLRSILRPVHEWLDFLRSDTPSLYRTLSSIYGEDRELIAERCRQIVQVLELFALSYGGNREVLVTRCPGRINLMGRHVDHRGGYVNTMTVQREIVVVASPRDDGRIFLTNTDPDFPNDYFDIAEELPQIREADNWREYLGLNHLRDFHSPSMGNWSNYVRAGVFRLCHHFPDRQLKGMDAAVGGDIPVGAGLSSYSALLLASSLALILINQLDIRPAGFVDLCGEGEWFVDARGEAAAHASVIPATPGKVFPVTFFPFRFGEPIDFPEGYVLVLCNSQVQAKKNHGAKDLFYHRIVCYELALALFRKLFPRHCEKVEHLRDVTPENLGVSLAEFYRMVLHLPETADRSLLRQVLQRRSRWLEEVFSTHKEPTTYPLRAVFLYGVAECHRSIYFQELFKRGDVETAGRLMFVSHDGDRIASFGTNGAARFFRAPSDDAYLENLILLANSPNPQEREKAALHWQPGGYACSSWEIDNLVDIARTVPGVVGAQLSGAGMGGCMMALVHKDAVELLREKLIREYYEPTGFEPQIAACIPISGASPIIIA